MEEGRHWDMDRLAAGQLAAALGLPEEGREAMAQAFARHRESAMEWAASRVRDRIGQGLESAMLEQVARRNEDWAEGVAWAQMQVAGMGTGELLGRVPGRPRTRGQVLRSLVRAARSDIAARRSEA
jgi:hypothetical protein